MKNYRQTGVLLLALLLPCASAQSAVVGAGIIPTPVTWGTYDNDIASHRLGVGGNIPVLQAAKIAGVEKALTDQSRVEVWYGNSLTDVMDVGAVRSGKTPDFELKRMDDQKTAPPNSAPASIRLLIRYPSFDFPGGTPQEFVAALEKQFGADWGKLELSAAFTNVHVPQFRVDDSKDTPNTPTQVVRLYNRLSQSNPALGTWNWEGDIYQPSVVILALAKVGAVSLTKAPPPTDAFKVKPVSLANIDAKNWDRLTQGIVDALQTSVIASQAQGRDIDLRGSLSIQKDFQMLIVTGTPGYIDFVEAYVAVFAKNQPPTPAKPGN